MPLIPARLHYCWFGPEPEPHPEFRDGWRALHPGARIVRWDERNAPVGHPYLADALRRRRYSKAADFMRLWLMIHHGGIYLDTDVECLRPLEPLRTRAFFVGFQRDGDFDPLESVNSAVLGARRGHWAAAELMRRLIEGDDGGRAPMESGPRLISRLLVEMGLRHSDAEVRLAVPGRDPVYVLPRSAFYPWSWEEKAPNRAAIGPDTFAVHHWDGSWVSAWKASRASGRP
jgi:Glycosyltransferase sugar-binding region containing DXD motif